MSVEYGTSGGGDKAHYKSYKKKYRKLRFKFDQSMRRSDELFKQDQAAIAAVRRIAEENTRLLDLLVDLNSSTHIPKSRRFNLGSPSCQTPTRFLSPTLLATIPHDETPGEPEPLLLLDLPVNDALQPKVEVDADTSSTSSDSDNEDSRVRTHGHSGKVYDSDNEDDDMDDDDREAYSEEIRETNYRRGIPGTPPRFIRDKLKADADRERKEAIEQARMAAEAAKQAAIDTAAATAAAAAACVKQEPVDETMDDALGAAHLLPQTPPRKPISLADIYPAPGRTPPYLRDPSPFLMSLEEEEAFYYNIDENLHGDIPIYPENTSPSARAESDPRNPMSVYCWLRKYQPQVFLQEGEGEKKPRGRGGRKKAGHDGDSGDEAVQTPAMMSQSAVKTGGKRRRADTMKGVTGEDGHGGMEIESHATPGRSRGGGRGRGGRRREGEPPVKKQRRLVARNS